MTSRFFRVASTGEPDRAIDALHRAIDRRDPFLAEVFFDPLLHPLRDHPRFAAVEERMGLRDLHLGGQ